jgi:Rps23 Pro-64 3,4-dihydroxylase Tpa1-like proline 4-hydroxylase
MAYLEGIDPYTGFVPAIEFEDKGKELAKRYASAQPFPSILIDDFLPNELANTLLEHFYPKHKFNKYNNYYNRTQERFKSSYNPDMLDEFSRTIFYSFNSGPFVKIIENITGIKGLIPDPYFLGAGFHEVHNGGYLSIHADFNHHKILNLERRITVLIYLNKDWKTEYGGQIELWDTRMTRAVQSHEPWFNRCVMFTTTSESLHGNPHPVRNPEGNSRKSVALYYYTSTWSNSKRSHTTQFKIRPETADRTDWLIRRREWLEDFLPPLLIRNLVKIRRLLKR